MKQWALISIFSLILLVACSGQDNALFQCKGGQMVSDPQECPEMSEAAKEQQEPSANEPDEAEPTKATPNVTVDTTQSTVPANTDVEPAPFNRTIPGLEDETETMQEGNYVSLKGWSLQEIIEAMAVYNTKFSHIRFWTLRYPARNDPTYEVGSGVGSIEDPFYMLRAQYAAGSKESLEYPGFRIDITPAPEEFLTLIEEKHNDTKFKLVYPDQWTLYDQISCRVEQSCRNIEAVYCVHKAGHELYIWLPRDPNIGYTDDTKYTMMAIDDKREVLSTFEKFYCTPI